MESLRENRFLLYSILASTGLVVVLSLGLSHDLTNMFEIVDFPNDVSINLLVIVTSILAVIFIYF